MSAVLSRRTALRSSAVAALGLVVGVDPVLAAPISADPDAALIAFAGRVERLARGEDHVRGRMVDAEAPIDKWDFANRPREPKAPELASRTVVVDLSTASHHVMQWSEPRESDPAQVVVDAAHGDYLANCEAHRRAVEARVAGSRVPRLDKLANRLLRRLVRDVDRLTDMQPSTAAGLAAKAAAVVALGERNCGEMDRNESRLALSLCEEAMRLFGSVPTLTGDRHA